ncbi:TasA family protein [Halorhabdus amylolytica]|uniref:TasA family protein n=1 Tax=Halorhabdus amylolytica TaxID=2559573 RepID=UPI0010A9FE17|nr:TasA family protein [Halorhabdus amylolytica]
MPEIELTRRRVLGGLITVGAASAAAGAGTFALFSDTETSSGNEVTAGTLDLQIDPDDSATTSLSVGDVKPTDGGAIVLELTNAGSIDANVAGVTVESITESDGTADEFTDTDTSGDLADNLEIEAFVLNSEPSEGEGISDSEINSGGTTVISDGTTLSSAGGTSNSPSSPVSLNPSETKYLVVNYHVPDVGNVIQGDTVTFDLTAEIEQS